MKNQRAIQQLKEQISLFCAKDVRIAAVYLFGSMVTGPVHEKSDIDLAILLMPGVQLSLDDVLDLEVNITRLLKTEQYDLVIANTASLILQFRIISTGKIIYLFNDEVRSDFQERVMIQYYDFLPRLRQFNQDYFSGLKEFYR